MKTARSLVAAGVGIMLALAALALPVAAQSPSPAAASPAAAVSSPPAVVLGPAPSGYAWAPLAAPAGAETALVVASDVTADGTWVALAQTLSFTADAIVWLLGPADTAVDVVKIPKSNESSLLSLSRLGDRLLSVGRGKAWSSADGSTWKPAKVKLKGLFPTLSASTGDRVAVLAETMSNELVVLTTTDGKTFTKVTIAPPEGGRLRSEQVAISPMGSIAVAGVDGDLNTHLWSSVDGTTFTEAVLPFDAAPYNSIRALHAAPGGFVLVGGIEDGGRYGIYTSPDGQVWTQVHEVSGPWIDGNSLVTLPAVTGGGLLVAGDGFVLTSPDGTTWTETAAPELAGQNVTSAVALPDGRVVFAVRTPGEDGVTSLLIGTPQP